MKIIRLVQILILSGATLAATCASAIAADGSAEYPGGNGGDRGDLGTTTGGLPFTGADLALYVIVGLAILAGGLALSSFERRSHAHESDSD
jgi:hypothetical protein